MNYKFKYIFITISIVLIFLTSCLEINSTISNENMTVIKDCTGSYLRFNNKDYHICNIDIVEEYDNNTEVKASFNKIDSCSNFKNLVVCMMYHENEGLINITNIERK